MPPLVIGIAGGSGSGKTTVTTAISEGILILVERELRKLLDIIVPEGGHNWVAIEMLVARVQAGLRAGEGSEA